MATINAYSPILRNIPANQQVVAGATVTFNIPVGELTYSDVTLYYTKAGVAATYAQMVADITRARVKLNGIVIQELTGKQFLDTFAFLGHTLNNGELPFIFAQPTARTPVLESLTSLGTAGLNQASIEVDVAAGAGANLAMSLNAMCHKRAEVPGMLLRRSTFNLGASIVGLNEFATLPVSIGDLVSIHFDGTSAPITAIEMRLDDALIYEGPLTVLHNRQKRYGRVPQTNYVHIDMCLRDNLAEKQPLADTADFRLKITTSAAGNIPVVMDTLAAPFGLPAAVKK